MSAELEAVATAGRAYRKAEMALDRRRDELAQAIVAAATVREIKQTDIVKASGYTREHVRRIIRHAADLVSRSGDPF